MSQQITINVQMDKEVKEGAESLFSSLGLSVSDAINAFFRKAVQQQAMPFDETPEFEDYTKDDPYFTPEIMAGIKESEEQYARGEYITFSMAEFDKMAETGEVPQRAIDFLNKYGQGENL